MGAHHQPGTSHTSIVECSGTQHIPLTPPLRVQLCAAPFSACALLLPVPWAYLSLIPGNIIGEMWVGVCLALVIDLVPANMRASCTWACRGGGLCRTAPMLTLDACYMTACAALAVYFFIIANVGGNSPVLVPYLSSLLGEKCTCVCYDRGCHTCVESSRPTPRAQMR